MTTPSVGTIGERLDIVLRQGDTLGPYDLFITDENGAAVDITGATFEADVSLLDEGAGPDLALTATPDANPLLGKVVLSLAFAGTEDFVPGDDYYSATEPKYAWRIRMTDSASTRSTLLYGDVFVAPEGLP